MIRQVHPPGHGYDSAVPEPPLGQPGDGRENDSVTASQVSYVNEHCAYGELPRPDRRALTELLSTAFPIGKSAHKLWRDFRDTTAFVRRMADAPEGGPAQGILGGAIVMSYPQEQFDYLAYIAVLPEYRRQGGFLRRGPRPHHGTQLLHSIYDVMRSRVSASRLQQYLMIEPTGQAALKFYLNALPANEYPLKFYEEDRVITVAYDGFML